MTDPLIEALKALCAREGGHKKVAAISGHGAHSIYEIVSGVKLPSGRPKGVGRQLRDRLNRNYPGWLDGYSADNWTESHPSSAGTGSRGRGAPVAQDLIHPTPTIDFTTIEWESILIKPLPPRFRVRVPDDAMALDDPPSMRAGDWADFVPASDAQPNQVVLIADGNNNVYIRRYTLRRPGHWTATARHSGYLPMDSIEDALRVLAVQVGASWG